ncbi:uncharacterized protein LOC121826666 isoform X2 [Peromyscus maniculatus bairdii]|uniref:uncharacterized protein LOC121826666 isoform X2 n=1 Tax=Peromyscus maniculatus bairdii TaxID=230844 RepID=UPI003FD570CF
MPSWMPSSRIRKKRTYTVAQQRCLFAVSAWMPVVTVTVGMPHLEVFQSTSLYPGNPQFPGLHQVLDSQFENLQQKLELTTAQNESLLQMELLKQKHYVSAPVKKTKKAGKSQRHLEGMTFYTPGGLSVLHQHVVWGLSFLHNNHPPINF